MTESTLSQNSYLQLKAALMKRSKSQMTELLSQDLGPDFWVSAQEQSTLFHEMVEGNAFFWADARKILTNLIEKGADINTRRPDDDTQECALHTAVSLELRGLVKVFLELGADPNLSDRYGMTPLHSAMNQEYRSYLNDEIFRLLITYGADVNFVNQRGQTPLHLAVKRKNGMIISELLKAGANPYIKDHNGVGFLDLCRHYDLSSQTVPELEVLFEKESLNTTLPHRISASGNASPRL